MTLIGENLTDHQSEAVGRTGNEDARHAMLPTFRLPDQYRSRCFGLRARLIAIEPFRLGQRFLGAPTGKTSEFFGTVRDNRGVMAITSQSRELK